MKRSLNHDVIYGLKFNLKIFVLHHLRNVFLYDNIITITLNRNRLLSFAFASIDTYFQ